MESSIAVFLSRQPAFERLPTAGCAPHVRKRQPGKHVSQARWAAAMCFPRATGHDLRHTSRRQRQITHTGSRACAVLCSCDCARCSARTGTAIALARTASRALARRGLPRGCLLPSPRKQGSPPTETASAGNRTRVTSMATMYSATRPLMPPQPRHGTRRNTQRYYPTISCRAGGVARHNALAPVCGRRNLVVK